MKSVDLVVNCCVNYCNSVREFILNRHNKELCSRKCFGHDTVVSADYDVTEVVKRAGESCNARDC